MPLTLEHTALAGQMSSPHRDPFDRMLAAQAIAENVTLATADPAFSSFHGLLTLW